MINENEISYFLRMKIAMSRVVPLVREFQKEFGEERVNAVLERINRNAVKEAEKSVSLEPNFEEAAKAIEIFAADDALEYEILKQDNESLEFNVTRCRYKQMMEELDATDIGHLLICDTDFATALLFGMRLERTQICMQGADHCDFRYSTR